MDKNKKLITTVVIVAVVLILIMILSSSGSENDAVIGDEENVTQEENAEENTTDTSQNTSQSTSRSNSNTRTSTSNTTSSSDSSSNFVTNPAAAPAPTSVGNQTVYTVNYLSSGFAPRDIQVKAGDVVQFVNRSGGPMYIVSENYPGYEQNACGTGAEYLYFDQCREGSTYSFTLTRQGSWSYHNTKVIQHQGTILVQ